MRTISGKRTLLGLLTAGCVGMLAVAVAADRQEKSDSAGQSDKISQPAKIGQPAPAIGKLPAVSGKTVDLGSVAGQKATVIVFTCNHCPVAQAYIERFNQFVNDYDGKQVGFLAISVSTDKADRLDAMKSFAQEHDVKFPYAYDESQASGKAFGATVTPHVFVLDGNKKLAYMGAWDDSWQNPNKVQQTYVRDAVDALIAGKQPTVSTTQQVGCGIQYH